MRSLLRILLVSALAAGAPLASAAVDRAPKLKVKDLDGQKQELSQYDGKIVVLNFWATWCGPCQEEMPMMVAEEQKYRSRGIVFIGVSMDKREDLAKIRAFAAKVGAAYPIWIGTVDDLERFKLGPGIPATAFIDADGNIQGRVLGEIHKPDLEHRINWLLGDHEGAPPVPLENNLNAGK
jgi:thiol-disulfide isomerase/thioredoxin